MVWSEVCSSSELGKARQIHEVEQEACASRSTFADEQEVLFVGKDAEFSSRYTLLRTTCTGTQRN